ncbi:unnamed protein product [Cylindrotheca closterium]|uniref:Uncharacterized protein n=1 Tax=Cylindrotheca closterium TaxID=2856 RepID=A0AAD2FKR5_9STRA|nr:unnamed protein product [Cylindrotheca closterium]
MGEKRKVDDGISKTDGKKLTNRQKRKKLNEKNKWPQHPKIQSMDQRAKAYIRVAGFGNTSKSKETIDPKLDLMSPEVKFGSLLGGTDQRKRHAAVNKLKEYLRARCAIDNENGGISELDLLKLWKGLWYTLYMADKAPVQDELSKRLAELLWCVAGTEEEDEYAGQAYLDMCEQSELAMADDFDEDDVTMEEIVNILSNEVREIESDSENESEEEGDGEDDPEEEDGVSNKSSLFANQDDGGGVEDEEESVDDINMPHCRGAHLASIFIRTFLRTIRREWGGMDKYRVDKFYTLMRLYLHEVFKYMATRHWNLGIIRLFNDAIFEEVLSQTPNGLRYHLIDITLDELARANAKAPMPLTEATFLDTLEPYFAMCQTGSNDDTLQARVLEKVVEKFLDEYSVISENALANDTNEGDDSNPIFDQVHVGSVAQFIFELASDPETNDRYRKSLYDMHKKYMRRLKKVGFDVELDETYKDGGEGEEEEISRDEIDLESSQSLATEETPEEDKEKTMEDDGDRIERSIKLKMKHEKDDLQKKGSKKKKNRISKADAEKDGSKEETVMISISEQKHAKARGKKQKKTVEDAAFSVTTEEQTESDGRQKRVKFTRTNRSKSYKASIKALVTSTPPKTSVETPEKSILRSSVSSGCAVVGCGVLGTSVCQQFVKLPEFESQEVVGITKSNTRHEEILAEVGKNDRFRVATIEDCAGEKYKNVVFCAPPSGFNDYSAAVDHCMKTVWAGPNSGGVFIFTSSGGVYGFGNDKQVVTENSPVADPSKNPRAARLINAEERVLYGDGACFRLAGLYSLTRGAHNFWLTSGKDVSGRADGIINQLHYDDAARAVLAGLSAGPSAVTGNVFLISDGHPLTREQICESALKNKHFSGYELPKFLGTNEDPVGKIYDGSASNKALKWDPVYQSFGAFMVSGES